MNLSKALNLVLAICLVVLLVAKQKGIDMKNEVKTGAASIAETASKHLFDTTAMGQLSLKNRFIRASIGDHTPDGRVDDSVIARYKRVAEGGVGTILTGYTLVDGSEQAMGIMGMYDDTFIAGNKRLTETVHAAGSNILMQLVYIGSNFHVEPRPERILSASAVQNKNSGVLPQAMTVSEIEAVVQKFAEAALRAKTAGYDGVEIHACHGYLLNQFATPYYNRRTDRYGGSRENRYRITIEVYEAIRQAVGEEFPVWIKVQSQDGFDEGVTNEDCLYLCRELAKRGIDAIEVSGNFSAFRDSKAFFRDIADRIGRETGVAVIVTGGNRVYEEMERMINETAIDYIGMARPLIAQPDLINRFRAEHE